MPQMSGKTGLAAVVIAALTLFGCSDPREQSYFNPDTGKHTAGWANPDVHGATAKGRVGSSAGFSTCEECHNADFSGGISDTSCFTCHGVSAPHPAAPWRSARTHATTDESNAPVCANCHTNGANSTVQPSPPAAAGTPAGCFNGTLCHAAPGHPAGWGNPAQHGASAKSQANGFSQCQPCHGANFAGLNAAPSCLQDALCHGATVTSPHPPTPWTSGGSVRTHTDTNTGNASVCALCHTGGANMTSLPTPTNPAAGTPGCFNSTLCHGQAGHAAGWASPGAHGAAAKSTPSVSAMQGFSTCQTCHGNAFSGGTATTCLNTAGCHGAGVNSPHARAPWISSISSTMTHTSTNTANATMCGYCHEGEPGNGNHPYTTPGPVGCFDSTLCHAVKATTCIGCHGSTQGTRDAVVGEFGLAWGHKKTGRGAVSDADCIVCHLEGNYATQVRSAFHGDGNIDLRDPDGAGETPITNVSGGAFTFTKFATSYTGTVRFTDGHTRNDIDNVLTQKFCLACHDSNGATNATARTAGGTQYMPWGGINLGANYTVANGAAAAGGVIDTKTQFATTNSSVHPVLGPRSSDYPVNTRLATPYNNIGTTRVAGAHNLANSVVINCFDCHNTPTAPLTNRTVVAHGNAVTLRGTIYVNGAASTLCTTCHTGYTSAPGTAGVHGSGSAWQTTGSSHDVRIECHGCHGSNTGTARAVRPLGAQDYHGNNALVGGGLWPTINSRPYAFIRGWTGGAYHRPYRSSEFTTGNPTCGAGTCPTDGQVGDGSNRTYSPGGTY
jgi:hypothetical protein